MCVWERENFFFNICFVYSHSTYRPQTLMNFIMVKINLDHLNEWVIFIWIALTPIFKLGRPAQRPLRWSLHRLAFSMWVKQSDITSHLWVLRPRSTIKLSPTIRSVATETQWSRPLNLRIVYEFLLGRTTETDGESGPSVQAKRPVVGKAHTYICMPHNSGGDNHSYGHSQRKKMRTTSTLYAILTIGVLWQKTTNMLHHAGKQHAKIWPEKNNHRFV